PGGYTWRADSRLRLPYPLRLDPAQAEAFVRAVRCPVTLVLARAGLLAGRLQLAGLLEELPFEVHELPGGHHLHLDDEAGAQAVADCLNPFFCAP
ncbi:alpha/beta hydrolase, partial [Azotobacter beijerinckii]|nr:alpha/beta hydrolase [Azotobacter beijerinckii]